MRRAILYPCDREALSVIRNLDMCIYDIKYIATLKGFDLNFNETKGVDVREYDSNMLRDVDCMVIMETEVSVSFEDVIYPKILEAAKQGKDIVIAKELEDREIQKCKQLCEANNVQFRILRDKADLSKFQHLKEENVDTPVIFVAGVSINTEKFDVQMAIRRKFIKAGYKVSQIGSKKNCELMGFHSFPQFMSENAEDDGKIVLLKKYIKYVEVNENPEIIIIGIPGGIMPLNRKHHFDFGLTAFMVANAVRPDYVIMSLFYCPDYTKSQLEELSKACNGRLNFEIDSYHISNVFIEPTSLNDIEIKYIGVEYKDYEHNVENLWNMLSDKEAEKAFNHITEKLASYNINQI